MEEKTVRKLEDNELDEVNGGFVMIQKLPFVEGQDDVQPKTAIMSGDGNPDPILLKGTGGAIVRDNTTGSGTTAVRKGVPGLLDQNGQKA